jgi:hypothetical protein
MESQDYDKTLRILNFLCMSVHGIFCGIWIKKKIDNYKIPTDLKVYTSAIKNVNGQIKNVLVEKPDSIMSMDLRNLLIAFFGITSFVHAIYFVSSYKNVPVIGGLYENMIFNKNNYIRWIEYSITATLMINIVARSAGINTEDTLILANLATACVMLQGQTIEMALQEKPSSARTQRLIIYNICITIKFFLY